MEFNKDNNRGFINQRGSSSLDIPEQSSVFSHLTEQPHPAGPTRLDFTRPDREYSRELQHFHPQTYPHTNLIPHRSTHHRDMDESCQREIEKQRIRQEILMSEVARRRVLEAEVIKELLVERELARCRVSDGLQLGSSSSLTGFNSSLRPNERKESGGFEITEVKPVLEVGREKPKIMLLAKRGENTVGPKRKASTPPPEVDARELSNKKVKAEWSCDVCQISATCEQGLQDHFRGRKHKSKEAALTPQKTRKDFSIGLFPKNVETNDLSLVKENEASLDNSTEKQSPVAAKVQKNDNSKNYGLWCDICNVGVTSHTNMETHKRGKRHVVRLLGIVGPGPSGNKDTMVNVVNHEEVVEEGKSATSESVVKAMDDVVDDVAVNGTEAGYDGPGPLGKDVTLDEEAVDEMEGGDEANVEDESKNDFDEEMAGMLLQFFNR